MFLKPVLVLIPPVKSLICALPGAKYHRKLCVAPGLMIREKRVKSVQQRSVPVITSPLARDELLVILTT